VINKLNILYKIWIVISLIFPLIGVINFWPNYVDNEFPLFNDIVILLIFLPSFFIFFFSVLTHLISKLLINKTVYKFVVGITLYCLTFLVLYFIFKDIWSINVRIATISLTSLAGLIHYWISLILSFKFNAFNGTNENIWRK
jgi:hypothetical protein